MRPWKSQNGIFSTFLPSSQSNTWKTGLAKLEYVFVRVLSTMCRQRCANKPEVNIELSWDHWMRRRLHHYSNGYPPLHFSLLSHPTLTSPRLCYPLSPSILHLRSSPPHRLCSHTLLHTSSSVVTTYHPHLSLRLPAHTLSLIVPINSGGQTGGGGENGALAPPEEPERGGQSIKKWKFEIFS